MTDRSDITSRADILKLTTAFYRRAFADALIGPIFTDVARMDLEAHLPVICDFWENVLFRTGVYRGGAFAPHIMIHRQVELDWPKFARWLELWTSTVDELFAGDVADTAKQHAERVALAFHQRLAGSLGGAALIALPATPRPSP